MSKDEKQQPQPQTPPPPPRNAERTAAAYAALRKAPSDAKYRAFLRALEADILEGFVGYLPVRQEDVEKLAQKGEIRWSAIKTQQGPMLAVFSSPEESSKNADQTQGSLALPLGIFMQTLARSADFTGLIFNPFDEGGLAVPREHALKVLENVHRRTQRLDQPVVVDALWRLWDDAAGVPFPYKDVRAEVADLGGVDRIMGPVMLDWKKRFDANEVSDRDPLALMKAIATDVLRYALAAAVGAKVRPGLFDKETPYEWLRNDVVEADGESLEEEVWLFVDGAEPPAEKVERLRADIARNVDRYLELLSANLREQGLVKEDDKVAPSMLTNAGPVCFGLMSFGIGWGTALYLESRGPEAVAAAKARQEEFLAAAKKA